MRQLTRQMPPTSLQSGNRIAGPPGLANGLGGAVTLDGGATWSSTMAPFTRCGGGTAANGGDYERATDPWVTFAPNGNVFQMALATQGASFSLVLSVQCW